MANGWDNVIVCVGDNLAARLPRRQMGADLVLHERRWLPDLAARLSTPFAAPVRLGWPGSWSICPSFDGDVAADVALAAPGREAEPLGAFVDALHLPALLDAPDNRFRVQPIADLVPRVRANLGRIDLGMRHDDVARRLDRLAMAPEPGFRSWWADDEAVSGV